MCPFKRINIDPVTLVVLLYDASKLILDKIIPICFE